MATKVPKLDSVFRSALGKTATDRSDELAVICTGSACISSQPMEPHGGSSKSREVVPTDDILRVIRETLTPHAISRRCTDCSSPNDPQWQSSYEM